MIGSCTYLSSWLSPLRRGHPHFITVEGSAGFLVGGRNLPSSMHRLENAAQVVYQIKIDTRRDGAQNIPTRFYYETNPPVEHRNPFGDRALNYADEWGASDIIADALAGIHRSVTSNSEPKYGIADARRDQELSIAISHSAALGGQPVRLPLGEQTGWEREQHEKFRVRWGGNPFKDARELLTRNFSGEP